MVGRTAGKRREVTADQDLSVTADGVVIRLEGNIQSPADASTDSEQGGEGDGLFRSEFLLAEGTPVNAKLSTSAPTTFEVSVWSGRSVLSSRICSGGVGWNR